MTALGISTPFEALFPSQGQVIYALLTRPPLYSVSCETFLVRLACLIHAANVRSEPGSNPSLGFFPARGPTVRTASGRAARVATFDSASEEVQRDFEPDHLARLKRLRQFSTGLAAASPSGKGVHILLSQESRFSKSIQRGLSLPMNLSL